MTLDHYVKTYRKISGLTQRDIAAMLGHNDINSICKIDNGGKLNSLELAIGLSIILDIPLNTLAAGMVQRQMVLIEKNANNYLNVFRHKHPTKTHGFTKRMDRMQRIAKEINVAVV